MTRVLATLSLQILKNCAREDVVDMLTRAGRHLIDAQWIGHQLAVNGVDLGEGVLWFKILETQSN